MPTGGTGIPRMSWWVVIQLTEGGGRVKGWCGERGRVRVSVRRKRKRAISGILEKAEEGE